MKMRTRILGRMLNSEVQQYLERNDIIIVPVGTTEMHGGMPLDCETVVSEAIGLKMAEACDALLLTGLPYFYAFGRGSTTWAQSRAAYCGRALSGRFILASMVLRI